MSSNLADVFDSLRDKHQREVERSHAKLLLKVIDEIPDKDVTVDPSQTRENMAAGTPRDQIKEYRTVAKEKYEKKEEEGEGEIYRPRRRMQPKKTKKKRVYTVDDLPKKSLMEELYGDDLDAFSEFKNEEDEWVVEKGYRLKDGGRVYSLKDGTELPTWATDLLPEYMIPDSLFPIVLFLFFVLVFIVLIAQRWLYYKMLQHFSQIRRQQQLAMYRKATSQHQQPFYMPMPQAPTYYTPPPPPQYVYSLPPPPTTSNKRSVR